MTNAKTHKTHMGWSIETPDGTCTYCGTRTILVVALAYWQVPEDQEPAPEYDQAFVNEEVSGHWCPECEKLTALNLNAW